MDADIGQESARQRYGHLDGVRRVSGREKAGRPQQLEGDPVAGQDETHVAVDIREENGEKYSTALNVKNQARDVKLYFALYADTRKEWLAQYKAFIAFLKAGDDGWLDIEFPDLDMTLRVFYKEGSRLRAAHLPLAGGQAGEPASTSLFGSRTRRFERQLNDDRTVLKQHLNDLKTSVR